MTSKQRAFLRGLGNGLDPIFQVGKQGVTPVMCQEILDALEAREIIKVTVLPNSGVDAREACDRMCALTGAEPVQTIGNRFVIYKASEKNPRIQLSGEPRLLEKKASPAPTAKAAAPQRYQAAKGVRKLSPSRTRAQNR